MNIQEFSVVFAGYVKKTLARFTEAEQAELVQFVDNCANKLNPFNLLSEEGIEEVVTLCMSSDAVRTFIFRLNGLILNHEIVIDGNPDRTWKDVITDLAISIISVYGSTKATLIPTELHTAYSDNDRISKIVTKDEWLCSVIFLTTLLDAETLDLVQS